MNRTTHHRQPEPIQWLDKALEGQPAETKARVLEIILKYGIDPQNEFFMIFVAIGQLQVLVQDSPTEWQDLFQDFNQDLNQWTDTNLQSLELLTQRTEAMAILAENSKELTITLTKFVTTCNALIGRLQDSAANSAYFEMRWQRSMKNLNNYIETLERKLDEQHYQMTRLAAQVGNPKCSIEPLMWIAISNLVLSGFLVLLFLVRLIN